MEWMIIFVLFVPLILELWNDSDGDANKGADVFVRMFFASVAAYACHFVDGRNLFAAFNLSMAIHWLLFDYLINIILYRNGVITSPAWFQYLGRSSKVDKIKFWKSIGPYGRLFVKLGYFLISIWLYLKF